MKIWEKIQNDVVPRGKYQIGFAKIEGLLPDKYNKYRFAISIVRCLENSIIDKVTSGPTKEYFDQYHEINNELDENAKHISEILNSFKIHNLPVSSTVHDSELPTDYYSQMRLPISHKMVATRAGIGWIGKTDLLVTRNWGPRVRLASVLLDTEIHDIGQPIIKSECGKCNRCVKNCPAQAATGKEWTDRIDRNDFYDPFKCRAMCRKLSREKINEEISLCGICVSICPKGLKKGGGEE